MSQMKTSFYPSRRTFLKASGQSLLLPLLPSLMPASAFSSNASAAKTTRPKRLCFVFFGMGVSLPPAEHQAHKDWHWFPHEYGKDYRFTRSIEALEPYRSDISFLSGLSHPRTRSMYSHSTGAYFLSGADPETPAGNSISADQVYAEHAGVHTRYPYLCMGTEGGIGDFREPSTLSYSRDGQPIPSIGTPRAVFDELFGIQQGGKETLYRNYGRDRSILDAVMPDLSRLDKALAQTDKARLEQYLTAVRGLETRLERAQQWLDVPKPNVDPKQFALDVDPIQDGPESFIDSMYQLIQTAFLTDSTRVVTFQKARESPGGFAGRFPEALGLPHHHTLSHEFNEKGGYERWGQYDAFLSARFAAFLKSMAETSDPYNEGSLLDNTIVLYGSGTSTVHNPRNFPLVLAGGKNLGLVHGEHRQYDEKIPMSNLLLSMLKQVDVPLDFFSESTGVLDDVFKITG